MGAVFTSSDVAAIVTHNADHPPQLAPLLSAGFKEVPEEGPGHLVLERGVWERRRG